MAQSATFLDPSPARKSRLAPLPDAITYTIPDAQRISGIGRTKLFELIKGGKLRVNRVTGRTLIVGDSLRALLNGEGV